MKRPRLLIGAAVLATALAGSVATVNLASAATDVKVTASIKVTGTYDGGGKRYIGSGNLGSGGQAEGQDPLFDLAAGATLKTSSWVRRPPTVSTARAAAPFRTSSGRTSARTRPPSAAPTRQS